MPDQAFSYGVIEGFYGHAWSWQARLAYADFLKKHDFSFYIYAPKSDAHLRSKWQDAWPADTENNIRTLAKCYQTNGVDWGLALSPLELYANWNEQAQHKLIEKIHYLNTFSPNILCVLFDDMRGDMPNLAQHQIEICHLVKEHSTAHTIIMCPTYYSYEPVLENLFGAMPSNYWQDLGAGLDQDIEIFWTGDQVCSTAYSPESLAAINKALQRNVTLWDNYPVNDGKKTSPYLHLKTFEHRPASLAAHLRRHVVNPMNAAFLSQIPLISLNDIYTQKAGYNASLSQAEAFKAICGERLAAELAKDLEIFQYQGLNDLSSEQSKQLLNKYQQFEHVCAQEVCAWLEGYYTFDPACLTG